MFLESFLTTIPRPDTRPTKLDGGDLGVRVGTRVTIPYLDSRLCSGIRLDMEDDKDIVDLLMEYGAGPDQPPTRDKTLAIALKTYYRSKPVFHGPLSAPRYDYVAGKVDLVAHDPSLRLKRAVLRSGDDMLADGYTLDGEGLLQLLDAGQNTDAQDALNWPSLGIVRGRDVSSAVLTTTKPTRGDYIWETMKGLADTFTGPDFFMVPIETDPAELASGPHWTNPGGVIPDHATTEYPLVVAGAGDIGGLRVGVWIDHVEPRQINLELVHPDGTAVRVYTGANEEDPGDGSGDFLGNGTGSDLAYFYAGKYPYDKPYPHVGKFRPDSPLGTFFDKPAAGTWKLRVIDTTAGDTGTVNQFRLDFLLPEPAYCRLDVADKPPTDPLPEPSCTFEAGHGADNAKIFAVTPQGDLVRNQAIATARGGTSIRVDDDSRADYGTYQSFESPGDGHSLAFLSAYASAQVGAYGRPVPAVELAPQDDGAYNETLRYGENFTEGGHVRAVGKRGKAYHDVIGRVTQAVLIQGKSSVATEMEVVPTVAGAAEMADG